ncbi:dipeptidyl peptidase 9 [Anopheles gambiae]|uniref:dipeptidyl peptidase 9 n=1 Tax=Anopheles gambiae TaxID=7165 RepID=UPI002AC8E424|nr:dipeptidyl peptidase 9 [Anopheles gambiae]
MDGTSGGGGGGGGVGGGGGTGSSGPASSSAPACLMVTDDVASYLGTPTTAYPHYSSSRHTPGSRTPAGPSPAGLMNGITSAGRWEPSGAVAPSMVPRKKSWSELKCIVNETRRQMATTMAASFPMSVNFRTLSDGRTRVYFLSPPPANGWDTILFYADVPAAGAKRSQLLPALDANEELEADGDSDGIDEDEDAEGERRSGAGRKRHLPWHQLLESVLGHLSTSNSREVQLMLERKRLSIWGITSYELHKASGKIVFPACNTLYQCLDTGYEENPLFPSELRILQRAAAIDPQICPQNSDLVAFVCNGDIWVVHTHSGHSERLTYAHDGRRSFAEDPLTAGVPSYVMQEEFSRYQGFWWQPESHDEVYRIVYEEVDESDVSLYTFPSSQSAGRDYEEYRFPRAGTPNAKSKLKLVQFRLSENLRITDVCIKELQCPLTFAFPWLEYIVRVGWTPDSRYVWAQLLDRPQQRLELVLLPVDNFCEIYSSSSSSPNCGTAATGGNGAGSQGAASYGSSPGQQPPHQHQHHHHHGQQQQQQHHSHPPRKSSSGWRSPLDKSTTRPLQVIYTETSSSWVNVHDVLQFVELSEQEVTFLWASEESGFRHLYLVTSSLSPNGCSSSSSTNSTNHHSTNSHPTAHPKQQREVAHGTEVSSGGAGATDHSLPSMACIGSTLVARIVQKVTLTAGDWEVLGRNVWYDRTRQLVYFMGLRETPLEKHLYVVSLAQPNQLRLLTMPGYSFTVEFNDDCTLFLQTYCNISTLPSWELVRIAHDSNTANGNGCSHGPSPPPTPIDALRLCSVGYLTEGGPSENTQYNPSIHSPQISSGDVLYAMVFKPHNFMLGVKYPTVLNVYGGPEVQTVSNTFKGMRQLRMHMLASQGYCVICVDSRGSRHRGVEFESYIRCRMGTVELSDQVEVLRILADQLGYIDMDRVAIHGWSYGGYLSLMGLVQYPEIFKVSIAGAPVTSWEYYDTGYTERYMDLPDSNRSGYAAGSVLNYIQKFPDEDNRLLIIHGLIDENVHFHHTSQLVSRLVRANKPYQLQVYPNERHSLRNLEASKHYETKLLSFLQNHL